MHTHAQRSSQRLAAAAELCDRCVSHGNVSSHAEVAKELLAMFMRFLSGDFESSSEAQRSFKDHPMSAQRRINALSKHLQGSDRILQFRPQELYLWLTRDNVELRDRMLDFLQVS